MHQIFNLFNFKTIQQYFLIIFYFAHTHTHIKLPQLSNSATALHTH